jgi:predicted PurR-regulated permease PerM
MPSANEHPAEGDRFLSRAVELSVRIGLVALLGVWCFQILRPFIAPVIWGAIIAVAVYPAHRKLAELLGGRVRLSAVLLTLVGLLLLLVPIGLFAGSLVDSAQVLKARIDAQPLSVPPPPANVADWPLIGAPLYELWSSAATNFAETLHRFAPQLKSVGGWLLAAGAGTGAGIAQFLVSLVISGVFLASSAGSVSIVGVLMKRVAGDAGQSYLELAGQTIRSVAVGILGVAVIQASLLGVGFAAVGLPHAGIWTVLCLGLGVLQLPAIIVVLPAVIYVFATDTTFVAVLFTAWSVLSGFSDTFLKPILLGRGASVPMLVIFLGSIGGFLWSGFIGLFVGAILLSLGYEMLVAWVAETAEAEAAPATPAAPQTAGGAS